ncbi:MAG: response regulator [Planctomycetes bacterium]|nr:response regulator [Planctomycetota bacterium]
MSTFSAELIALQDALEISVQDVLHAEHAEFEEKRDRLNDATRSALRRGGTGVVAALLAAILLGSFLARSIARPLATLTRASALIADGDLSARVPGVETSKPRADEVSTLSRVFNAMAERLEHTTVSREYLNQVLGSMSDMLLVTDPHGRIVQTNQAALAALGCTRDELVGKQLGSLQCEQREHLPPGAGPALPAGPDAAAPEPEITLIAKDGRTIPATVSRSCVHQTVNGERVPFDVLVFRDCSVRRRYEAQLLGSIEAAESANQAKSAFLANMSHELRTPLNGVIGMVELLLATNLSVQQRYHADTVRKSADALLNLINDILDFSKIEAGKLELEKIDFALWTTIDDAAAILAHKAEQKGLELACLIHPSVPSLLRGDANRLQQILTNLAGNAIKFTEKGEVIIKAALAAETPTDVTVRFTVRDTGIGIAASDLQRLFQTFSQVDSSTTRRYGGTGLGLAISKQLAELMGGQIGVESELGKGSLFWFTVRLEKSPNLHAARHTPYKFLDELRGLRVLAVDDNATNREILLEQLANWGLYAEAAPTAADGLDALRKAVAEGTPFRLALIDMQMPGMDGEQLAKAVKADPTLKDTLLIMLTSIGDQSSEARMLAAGFEAFLTKPVKQSRLSDTIASVVAAARLPADKREANALSGARIAPPKPDRSRFRILLAEDNDINQEVAASILAAAGYRCDAVGDGQRAVEAVQNGTYDLVLMDCQMPRMDGFEATRAIREFEKQQTLANAGNKRLPIVALTANAIKGDRELCLEAGMDDYLTKPLNPDKLIEVIDSHVSAARVSSEPAPADSSARATASEETAPSQAPPPPFDAQGLADRCLGNLDLIERLLAKFEKQAGAVLDEIERSVHAGNAAETARLAHGFKGSAANLSADALCKLNTELEAIGRAGDLSAAAALLNKLRGEVDRCLRYVPELVTNLRLKQGSCGR